MADIITMSEQQISQACLLWMHGIDDRRIATALGMSQRTFIRRIKNPNKQTFEINVFGREVKFKDTTLKQIKHAFKQMFEASYLQRLHSITDSAEINDDYKTASSNIKWLMEKIMPDKYGKTILQHDLPVVEIHLPDTLQNKDI